MNLCEFLTSIGFFAKYPYTDFHELNLDWCLAEIAKLRIEFDNFAHVNSLKYAGEWDITKSYSAFSVVDDQGFGYMALKPVAPGTQINDTEFWLMIVDYSQLIADYEARITALETTVGDASSGLVKDVNDLDGDITRIDGEIITINGDIDNLDQRINNLVVFKYYDTLSDLLADDLPDDVCVGTLGYHSLNDGGGALYKIHTAAPFTYYETLDNGLFAELIYDNEINVKQLGAYGDDVHDDTTAFKNAITYAGGSYDITMANLDDATPAFNIIVPSGKYIISEELRIAKNNIIFVGNGVLNTVIKCATNVIIEALLTFTGAYGCGVHDIQLFGSVPTHSTTNHNPVTYGACCGLWLDQIAYCTFTNVMIANTRNQGIRMCHVWQDDFTNILIYHTSGYGTTATDKYYGAAIYHSVANQINTTFNPTPSILTSESNHVTFNRLEVSGLLGATFKAANDLYNSTCQNFAFNDVIEENDLFNDLSLSDLPPCFTEDAWNFAGANHFITPPASESAYAINNHYIYYHNYTFNAPKVFYKVSSQHVNINNAIIYTAKLDATYPGISTYLYSEVANAAPMVDLHVMEENLTATPTINFDHIVVCQNLYGIPCRVQGNVRYTRTGTAVTLNVSDLIDNYTLFVGLVDINGIIYQCDGASPA